MHGVGEVLQDGNPPDILINAWGTPPNGDGECNEGSLWEAAMAAPNFKLDNLYAIIDKNYFQQTGSN